MTFAPADAAAMLRDMGLPVTFNGRPCGRGIVEQTRLSSPEGGFDVQRPAQVLRVVAGALGEWSRDDVVTVGGTRWRLRQTADDPRTLDGAFDLIEVGRA